MYAPPSIIRKGSVSLLFLIQYALANDLGLQAFNQEDSLASPPLIFEYTLPAISDRSQFTTPFTSGSTNSKTSTEPDPSETYLDPQDVNQPENFFFSNEYCNSAAKKSYPSRRRRKRQNEKDFCDNPTPSASHQLENNNQIAKPKPPRQKPNPNGSGESPSKTPTPEENINILRVFLNSVSRSGEKFDRVSCNNLKYPLFRVPVCSKPDPDILRRPSRVEVLGNCKYSK